MRVSASHCSKHCTQTYTHTSRVYMYTHINKNQESSGNHASYLCYLNSHSRDTVIHKKEDKVGHQEP